jgi:hypothetical protein
MTYTPPAPPTPETAAGRYDRDWLHLSANEDGTGVNRKTRGFDARDEDRKDRDYAGEGALQVTAGPSITGTAQVGQTLTASSTWTNSPTLARQWYADGAIISGATSTTYVPVSGDIGKKITVTVTASKTGFSTVTATSAPTVAVIA